MGAGKSTAAVELAEALGVTALDSDRLLEERFGHPVAREFELQRRGGFQEGRGAARVRAAGGAPGRRDVIALGGGSVLSERVRDGAWPPI